MQIKFSSFNFQSNYLIKNKVFLFMILRYCRM